MNEFLSFRRMITPIIIQVLFWLGVVIAVVGGIVTMAQGMVGRGLVVLILGPITVRVYCELLILAFRINDAVQAIAASKGVGGRSDASQYVVPPGESAHEGG